ncbi:hypothetical protein NDU88_006520 [Pleurodeles waltl]|uniref:Uncharacterized protein n=1 Tax=Pleurodeles waltl TaxID=8319 RepID=A0AAV7VMZ6_PLEWA|nr:hypothetical protein NDU88_006520 [Pleurodeles waltl]
MRLSREIRCFGTAVTAHSIIRDFSPFIVQSVAVLVDGCRRQAATQIQAAVSRHPRGSGGHGERVLMRSLAKQRGQ